MVASTTAFVRHNLPAAAWGPGIGAFTIDFVCSAIVLALGAVFGSRQRPLRSA